MQAIICAAGRGSRMKELSEHTPKPLLSVNGLSLIEHKIRALPPNISEVICVVNHLQNLILERLGDSYNGIKVTYVTDVPLTGTDTAVRACAHLIHGNFLVLMGDDIYHPDDMRDMVSHPCALLLHKNTSTDEEKTGGKVILDSSGHITDIIEGATIQMGEYLNCGMYVLPLEYFQTTPIQIPGRSEFGLPQTIVAHTAMLPNIIGVTSRGYCQVTAPHDLTRAEEFVKTFLT